MKDAILGKALLNEIEEKQPDVAQTMSNYFYYEICNSLCSMMSEYGSDKEQEEWFIEEIIHGTRQFMKSYIEIYKKYNDLY